MLPQPESTLAQRCQTWRSVGCHCRLNESYQGSGARASSVVSSPAHLSQLPFHTLSMRWRRCRGRGRFKHDSMFKKPELHDISPVFRVIWVCFPLCKSLSEALRGPYRSFMFTGNFKLHPVPFFFWPLPPFYTRPARLTHPHT